MPGVVNLPRGYNQNRKVVNLSIANALTGSSANDLTDELVVDQVSGIAAFNGVEVTVKKAYL